MTDTSRDALPPAAQRALAEAEERRKNADAERPLPKELGGRDGPEPVPYGDWEKKGTAVHFLLFQTQRPRPPRGILLVTTIHVLA